MSKRRKYSDKRSYHISQRCHKRSFFLKFREDRDNYLRRLWEAKRKYDVDLYNYAVTSNHVHLLLSADDGRSIPEFMCYLSGRMAQDHNRRKGKRGAFWDGPFRPTLVQDGSHFGRCLFYLDLNMIRAGVVNHPGEWKWCGHHELIGSRQRYCLLDREKLLKKLCCDTWGQFLKWYQAGLAEKLRIRDLRREAYWSESNCVGDEEFVSTIVGRKGWRKIREVSSGIFTF